MSFVLAYSFCACIECDSFNNLTKSLMKPVTAVFIMSNQYICTPKKKSIIYFTKLGLFENFLLKIFTESINVMMSNGYCLCWVFLFLIPGTK